MYLLELCNLCMACRDWKFRCSHCSRHYDDWGIFRRFKGPFAIELYDSIHPHSHHCSCRYSLLYRMPTGWLVLVLQSRLCEVVMVTNDSVALRLTHSVNYWWQLFSWHCQHSKSICDAYIYINFLVTWSFSFPISMEDTVASVEWAASSCSALP